MPLERDPRPVYIVANPTPARNPRNWFGLLVIAALVVLVGGGALQQAQRNAAPTASPGLFSPAAAAPLEVRPTPFNVELDQAIQAALNRQQDRLNAQTATCNGLTNDDAAYAKCDRQYAALDKQYDALNACTDGLSSVDQVAACERKVGIH